MAKQTTVKCTYLSVCTRPSTDTMLDEIHNHHLYQQNNPSSTTTMPHHDTGLTTQLGRLANAISAQQLSEDPSTAPLRP